MKSVSLYKIVRLIACRGVGVVLQVLMQFAIARVAGPAGLGLIQLYQTWTCVMGETVAMGLPTQTMKSVSVESANANILNRYRQSLKVVAKVWSAFALVAILFGLFFPHWLPISAGASIAVVWSFLCFAILRISAEALKAMDCAGEGVFAENAIFSSLMVLFCLALVFNVIAPANVTGAPLIYAASLFLTIASAFSLVRCIQQMLKIASTQQAKPEDLPLFTKETPFFWGTAILSIGFLNLPFLLMPYFGDLEEIGLFTLAFKFINPISTILIMLGAIFAPKFAQAAASRDAKGLQRLLIQSQLVSLALYLPVLLPLLLFADPILGLFGNEFMAAKPYLFLLAAAHLVNAFTGLSGNLLNMVGQGKKEFQGSLLFFALAVLAGVIAGVQHGLVGVAVVYSVALVLKNLWSYGFALLSLRPRFQTSAALCYN